MILCHWQYGSGLLEGPEHYRPDLAVIAERGLSFYANSCTWSLMKIHPDLGVARANLDSFMPEAKKYGAMGMMTTIWGDMGHMNQYGLESYPLVLAARHGWEDDPDSGEDMKAAFSWMV